MAVALLVCRYILILFGYKINVGDGKSEYANSELVKALGFCLATIETI